MIPGAALFAVAFVTTAATNAPVAFSTEAERTFAVPDIAERNVWLDCSVGFAATTSNRVERVYPVSVGLLAARGTEGRLSFLVEGTTDTCLFHDQEMTRPVQAGTDVSFGGGRFGWIPVRADVLHVLFPTWTRQGLGGIHANGGWHGENHVRVVPGD